MRISGINTILFDMDDTILRLDADWGSAKEKIRAIYKSCGGELEILPGQLLHTISKLAKKHPAAADEMLKLVVENAKLIVNKNSC